jgi:hypothetical protein
MGLRYDQNHDANGGEAVDSELMPPDFRPGLLTRLRLWRAHGRLHQIIRATLLSDGRVGQAMDCAHCHRRWILGRTQYATYLREAHR